MPVKNGDTQQCQAKNNKLQILRHLIVISQKTYATCGALIQFPIIGSSNLFLWIGDRNDTDLRERNDSPGVSAGSREPRIIRRSRSNVCGAGPNRTAS